MKRPPVPPPLAEPGRQVIARRRIPLVWLVTVVGLAASAAGFVLELEEEEHHTRARFEQICRDRASLIQDSLNHAQETLLALAGYFESSQVVTRPEFRDFTRRLLNRPDISALEWIPRVPAAERAAFEGAARAEGFPDFEIKEPAADGGFQRAPERAEHFPVLFSAPAEPNRRALGKDQLAFPICAAALGKTRDTGQPAAAVCFEIQRSGPDSGFRLKIFEAISTPGAPPRNETERRERLAGSVAVLLRVSDLVRSAGSKVAPAGMDIALFGPVGAAGGETMLYFQPTGMRPAGGSPPTALAEPFAGLRWEGQVWLADQPLRLVCHATPQFAEAPDYHYRMAWGALAVGLVLTALAAGLAGQQARRIRDQEQSNRTLREEQSALSDANGKLLNAKLALETMRQELLATNLVLQHQIAQRTQREAELAAVYDAAPIMLGLVDQQMRLVRVNRAWVDFTGRAEPALQGLDMREAFGCVMTDTGRRLEQTVRSLFHGAAAAPRQEIGVSVTRNGRPAQALLQFSCAGVEQAGGKRALVCLQDVTAAKQVEAQLRQSQKLEAIGTLAGGIAHDFNNILTGVINFTVLAREDCPPTHPQIREFLGEVLAGGRRAKDLVSQLMLFSRTDTGGQEPVRLQPIIREALALLRSTLPSTASMETDIAPEAPAIHGNPSQLHQVVMNLVINAAQALGGRVGRITVRLAPQQLTAAEAAALPGLRPGPHLRLEVADTGCGMDEAVIARIYEPFFTTKEVGQGTGLGLSVVHSVVRSHGGAIAVSSSPGAGTTFGIYFPLPAAAPATPEQGRAAIPKQ